MPFSTAEDLARAKDELLRLGPQATSNSRALLEYVRAARELGTTDCESTLEYGSAVLAKYQGQLADDERWQLHEDVAMAAFTCGQPSIGQDLIKKLVKRFPDSHRVECLRGMACESTGKLEEAEEIYDSILEKKATFPDALKRKIGLNVTRGNVSEAIAAAVAYLDIYQTDHAVWEQLHTLYLQIGHLSQAQYCLEEAMLHNPGASSTLLKLADLVYAQGGLDNVRAAYAYYTRVVNLTQGDSVRALYGLLAARSSMQATSRKAATHAAELAELSKERLLDLYRERAPSKVPLVESMLAVQG